MEIAKTILEQLKGDDLMGLMAWGAREFQNTGTGLQFKVSGAKMKGYVKIELDEGADLYDITFYKGIGKPKEMKAVKGIYFDEMSGLIDGVIER